MSSLRTSSERNERHWWAALIIVAPFLFVVILFNGMASPFPTFHDTDEVTSHFPTIERFYAQLPFPDVNDTNSATGPLFHILFAASAKLIGLDIQRLRLLNVVISVAAVFVFYGVVGRFAKDRNEALVLSLIFGLSPYFFGASFRLLTDNLGILFFLLALRSLILSWEEVGLRNWAAFCTWSCLAMLTRQPYVWLAAGAFLAMLKDRPPARQLVPRTLLLFGACVPLLILLLAWGGLTPPARQEFHVERSLMNFRAAVFGIAVTGLYWSALFPDRVVEVVRAVSNFSIYALVGIGAASLLLLIAVPMATSNIDDGVLWRITKILPTIGGSGALFWLLVPLGALFAADAIRSNDQVAIRFLLLAGAFLVCAMPNTRVYEKYFDPFVLTFVMVISLRVASTKEAISRFSRSLLLIAFALYPIVSWTFFYPR